MAVAIILEGRTAWILLGVTNLMVLPSELVNIFDIFAQFNLIEWFSKLHRLISIHHMGSAYCDQRDNRRKFAGRTMTSNVLILWIRERLSCGSVRGAACEELGASGDAVLVVEAERCVCRANLRENLFPAKRDQPQPCAMSKNSIPKTTGFSRFVASEDQSSRRYDWLGFVLLSNPSVG
jgi:hypothetical protein